MSHVARYTRPTRYMHYCQVENENEVLHDNRQLVVVPFFACAYKAGTRKEHAPHPATAAARWRTWREGAAHVCIVVDPHVQAARRHAHPPLRRDVALQRVAAQQKMGEPGERGPLNWQSAGDLVHVQPQKLWRAGYICRAVSQGQFQGKGGRGQRGQRYIICSIMGTLGGNGGELAGKLVCGRVLPGFFPS